MDALYRQFVRADDLVFDIGSHVGDRVSSFRRLGARVVAVEPQPGPGLVIRLLHGLDRKVTLLPAAVGAQDGEIELRVNSRNPTFPPHRRTSSLRHRARRVGGASLGSTIRVPMVTLDGLIGRFGMPAFVKIDVEGFEDAVLSGLSAALPALSFEFTTISREVAQRCVERIPALGSYEFNVALGETQRVVFERPTDCRRRCSLISAVCRTKPILATSMRFARSGRAAASGSFR